MALQIDPEKMLLEAMEKARTCLQVGDPGYAREILEQVLRCEPNHQSGLQLLAILSWREKRYHEAIQLFDKAILLNPTIADNYNNLSLCLAEMNDPASTDILAKAISLEPGNPKFRNNLAIDHRRSRRYAEAIGILEDAIGSHPTQSAMWINLAGMYAETHRLPDARRALKSCLEYDPDNHNAHVDLAYVLALGGDFSEEMWSEYEHRFDHFEHLWFYRNKYDASKRCRRGEEMSGKVIAVYCEQGLGDAIQFCRYLPALKAMGCRVLLHCSPALEPILRGQGMGIDEFFTQNIVTIHPADLPPHDLHVSIMSLPYVLGIGEIDGHPYIGAEPAELGGDRPKVGICWAGSPMHPHDSIRSCHLRHFAPLADIPGVSLYSLQYNISPRVHTNSGEIVDYTEGAEMRLVDLHEHMEDFSDAARLVAAMDIVVTVDTAVMHMSAAMGKPTIGLLAYNPDWRWKLEGDSTVWYDSLTILRQQKFGEWKPVLEEAAAEVRRQLA